MHPDIINPMLPFYKLYLEDGTTITTDRYQIEGILPSEPNRHADIKYLYNGAGVLKIEFYNQTYPHNISYTLYDIGLSDELCFSCDGWRFENDKNNEVKNDEIKIDDASVDKLIFGGEND